MRRAAETVFGFGPLRPGNSGRQVAITLEIGHQQRNYIVVLTESQGLASALAVQATQRHKEKFCVKTVWRFEANRLVDGLRSAARLARSFVRWGGWWDLDCEPLLKTRKLMISGTVQILQNYYMPIRAYVKRTRVEKLSANRFPTRR